MTLGKIYTCIDGFGENGIIFFPNLAPLCSNNVVLNSNLFYSIFVRASVVLERQ